jgi:hypothetical protein
VFNASSLTQSAVGYTVQLISSCKRMCDTVKCPRQVSVFDITRLQHGTAGLNELQSIHSSRTEARCVVPLFLEVWLEMSGL